MKELFSELKTQYDKFVKEYKRIPKDANKDEFLKKAEKLIEDIRDAGQTVSDSEQRKILSDAAYHLGDIIFKDSDFFPPVRLTNRNL